MKTIKMSLSTLIINVVIAVLVIVSTILLIVGFAKSEDLFKEYTKLSLVLILIAMYAFIALTNVSVYFKKIQMYTLIPILVMFVTSTTIESFFMTDFDLLGTSNQILGLVCLVLFIVSVIFALKGKKWAIITTIVILSLNMYYTYSNAVLTKSALGTGDSYKTILMLYGLGILLIAQVIYFVSLLYVKHHKQINEPVSGEEPVNNKITELGEIKTQE